MKTIRKSILLILAALMLIGCIPTGFAENTGSGVLKTLPNFPDTPSREEIIASLPSFDTEIELYTWLCCGPDNWFLYGPDDGRYAVDPSVKNWTPGEWTQAEYERETEYVNFMRSLAGLPALPNATDLNRACALYALACASGDTLYPEKPAGMSGEDWDQAYYRGDCLKSWFACSDGSSTEKTDHGAWYYFNWTYSALRLLDPQATAVGFGSAPSATGAVYNCTSVDSLNSYFDLYYSSTPSVAWPAPLMPVENFGVENAWAFAFPIVDYVICDFPTTTITYRKTGQTWQMVPCNKNNPFVTMPTFIYCLPKEMQDCFPDGFSDGDIFDVTIEGLDGGPYTYTTEFIRLTDETKLEAEIQAKIEAEEQEWLEAIQNSQDFTDPVDNTSDPQDSTSTSTQTNNNGVFSFIERIIAFFRKIFSFFS